MINIVNFALKKSEVKILGHHKIADGDTIYHVEDINTGHRDFVGSKYLTTKSGKTYEKNNSNVL